VNAPRLAKLTALLAILAFALFGPKAAQAPADDTIHGNIARGLPLCNCLLDHDD